MDTIGFETPKSMPTLDWNKRTWKEYNWSEAGEEWSRAWGTSRNQWLSSILPRLRDFLPVRTILEIAPGFGRWTQFLRAECRQLFGVDLNPACVEACQQRFIADPGASFFLNDGRSLAMIPDASIDFVFSFDSLVHVEADVIEAYLAQLAVKMTPDAIGTLHHSNLGAYAEMLAILQQDPAAHVDPLLDTVLRTLMRQPHNRALSVTAAEFEAACSTHGLECVGQELINWENHGLLLDCLSLITPTGSAWSRPNRVVPNMRFMEPRVQPEVLAALYERRGFDRQTD
ncbi:MAG TPA: class I SAM-dependent methyltransferase [Anaerolineales bacterium]|nr:class I SAM-dependent methyltransferase [Anaerolineales bacterium]